MLFIVPFSANAGNGGGLQPPRCDEVLDEFVNKFESMSQHPDVAERMQAYQEAERIKALRFHENDCDILKTIPEKYKPKWEPTSAIGKFFKWLFGG